MKAFHALIVGARLVVVAGPGGVGKTTTAAALAVASALEGRRTLVLTADPARRLADTLGLDAAAATENAIQVGALPLEAAMLESQRTFDVLLPRMVPDPAARARIEASPVYRRFSRSLARSHAYAALERLHAALEDPQRYEVVVLDTPPMRGMLDLMDAPLALRRFAGSRAVEVFATSGPSNLLGWSARRALEALAGAELGKGLSEFLAAFAPFREGFSERARAIADAQRASSTRTVLVTQGNALRIADARALAASLAERDVRCAALIGSAGLARQSAPWGLDSLERSLVAQHRAALEAAHRRGAADRERARREQAALTAFATNLRVPLVLTPRLPQEPTSVEALRTLVEGARRAETVRSP